MPQYIDKLGFVLKNYVDGLSHFVFTNVCVHCDKELITAERYLCWKCWSGLERTYFELQTKPSVVEQLFWNRVEVKHVISVYFYGKGKVSQSLIRALKYDFKAPLGIYLGQHMAELLAAHDIANVDAVTAVPIHPKKKFARGYNQSELLARGLAKTWQISFLKSVTQKHKHTKSQTTTDRFGRWENVQNMFEARQLSTAYKHVVIVDDVITTGATMASLAQAIKAVNPAVQISLLSFAYTN
jgi:ComF family protein